MDGVFPNVRVDHITTEVFIQNTHENALELIVRNADVLLILLLHIVGHCSCWRLHSRLFLLSPSLLHLSLV